MAKILISSIGSRGDVQPILALALQLKALGHEATLCAPPDFKSWVESFGIALVPVGPSLKGFSMRAPSGKRMKITEAQRQQMVTGTVREQFKVIGEAAKGMDLIVAGGALQAAARSIAEGLKIPYVYAGYCACTFASADHPPPPARPRSARSQSLPRFVNKFLWTLNERRWNSLFLSAINEQRNALGLAAATSMTSYVFNAHPWLAADAALGPAGSTRDLHIFQTGAWFLSDTSPLSTELEEFLANGEPPIYFGFGSTVVPAIAVQTLLASARQLGHRVIIYKGWANLDLSDAGADCIAIDDANHEKLFPRVAAIVHHGGAGTTTAAARAGKPQLIVPQSYDQYYWANRIKKLGIGTSIKNSESVASELDNSLRICLSPQTASNARELAKRVELNGASIAAQRLVKEYL